MRRRSAASERPRRPAPGRAPAPSARWTTSCPDGRFVIRVAPPSFKGPIGARDAAAALAAGARDASPRADVVELPVSDGGPGLIDSLRVSRDGALHTTTVRDPLGRPVAARILLVELADGPAAVVESADAWGMRLLATRALDPLRAR